ncbi:nucleolin 2-like protein isoform X3 [Tanacetum coccineum]
MSHGRRQFELDELVSVDELSDVGIKQKDIDRLKAIGVYDCNYLRMYHQKGSIVSREFSKAKLDIIFEAADKLMNKLAEERGEIDEGSSDELTAAYGTNAGNIKNVSSRVVKNVSSKVVVKNLPYRAREEDLHELFQNYGKVTEVKFDLERMGGFKGVAEVIFERAKDARKALSLDGSEFMDRDISVEMLESGGIKDNADPFFVMVRGLPRDINNMELEELFKTCCRKFSVKVPRESNKSYGYAFIEFPSKEACRKALELNGAFVRQTMKITVELGDPGRRAAGGGGSKSGRRAGGHCDVCALDTLLEEVLK